MSFEAWVTCKKENPPHTSVCSASHQATYLGDLVMKGDRIVVVIIIIVVVHFCLVIARPEILGYGSTLLISQLFGRLQFGVDGVLLLTRTQSFDKFWIGLTVLGWRGI